MAGELRLSTDQVAEIATKIEKLNNTLLEKLQESQSTIKNLSNVWESEAARSTIEAYDSFAGKYFQNYSDVIKNYITFLRVNVVQGYIDVENANVALADNFK